MLEISNWKVYDLEESINACRYSMHTDVSEIDDFDKSLERAKKLAKTPSNSGECNFLCGIKVNYDIKYPQYISPELQRYHFNDIVTSQSKMHSILKMDLDKICNQYVDQSAINLIESIICMYNMVDNVSFDDGYVNIPLRNGKSVIAYNKADYRYYHFMKIVSNCPSGLELVMRCTTNYLQLKNIYHQRRNHKLKEDWGAYCDWIEKLPYAQDLICK